MSDDTCLRGKGGQKHDTFALEHAVAIQTSDVYYYSPTVQSHKSVGWGSSSSSLGNFWMGILSPNMQIYKTIFQQISNHLQRNFRCWRGKNTIQTKTLFMKEKTSEVTKRGRENTRNAHNTFLKRQQENSAQGLKRRQQFAKIHNTTHRCSTHQDALRFSDWVHCFVFAREQLQWVVGRSYAVSECRISLTSIVGNNMIATGVGCCEGWLMVIVFFYCLICLYFHHHFTMILYDSWTYYYKGTLLQSI